MRTMVRGGWRRRGGYDSEIEDYDWALVYRNFEIYRICKTEPIFDYVDRQRLKWVAHVVRAGNDRMIKQSMFEESQISRVGTQGVKSILDESLKITRNCGMEDNVFWKSCNDRTLFAELENRGVMLASKRNGNF